MCDAQYHRENLSMRRTPGEKFSLYRNIGGCPCATLLNNHGRQPSLGAKLLAIKSE
jgi:hypothetical protein